MNKSFLLFFVISTLFFLSKTSNAQSPDWLWAKGAGGIDSDCASSVAVDASGNLYVAGYFDSPTITFGSTTLTNTGAEDLFLVKYDPNGNVLWATSAVGTGLDWAHSVALDASGNAYVAGRYTSTTIAFGSFTLTNAGGFDEYDIFLVKYDANGNVLWAKSEGGTDADYAYSVAVDASGNAYVTGFFNDPTITFGSYTLTNTGAEDLFLVKYDPNGNVLWATSAVGTGGDGAQSVVVDVSGNSYVAGYFKSPTINFGSTTLTNAGNVDVFLAKYDANGNALWAKCSGGTDEELPFSVAVDASGNLYMAGYFKSPAINFGSYTLTNTGSEDLFFAKYDSNGNALWANSASGTETDYAVSVAVDDSGNPYVGGLFGSPTITFGSYTLTNASGGDMFLVKYDGNGNVLWAKGTGGPAVAIAMSIAVDGSGNPYVAGEFGSPTITFGSTILTSAGSYDMFLAKLESSSTGIDVVDNSFYLSAFPNPTSATITIETTVKGSLSIHNISGQQLLQQEIAEPTNTIDVSGLKIGVYVLKVLGEKEVQVGTFVKQ